MKNKIGIFRKIEVHDKNGKLVFTTGEVLSESFVLAFLQNLEVQMSQTNVTIKATDNSDNSEGTHAFGMRVSAGSGDVAKGIVVGIGTTPVTNTDYVVETPIAHGVGAGQLQYGTQSYLTSAEVGANVDFGIIRVMTNGSGSTINVTESAIYTLFPTSGKSGMFIHDVFTAVPVLNGQTLTLTYTLRTTA